MAKLTEKQLLIKKIEMSEIYIKTCILMDTKHSQDADVQFAHAVLANIQNTLNLLTERLN